MSVHTGSNHFVYVLILFSLLILSPFSGAEQKSGTCRGINCSAIIGRILDPQYRVVINASVILSGSELTEQIIVRTDSAGMFTIKNLTPGNYDLEASSSGFATLHRSVALESSQHLDLRVVLQIATLQESVQVTDNRPVLTDILDLGDLRDSHAKDLGEALQALDGVWKIRKGGIANDVVVRGFQQNNVAFMIDGARIYGACPGHMDPAPQHVDFAEVERVEVTKGPFDIADQGTLGAVVKIITKEPGIGVRVKPSFSAGSFGYYNPAMTLSYGGAKFETLAGYSYRISDPYKDGSGRPFTAYANYSSRVASRRAFDINTGWFTVGFAPTDGQHLSINYTRQQSGLILYPYLTMDSDFDNADRAGLKYEINDLSRRMLRRVRVETYFTAVNHSMSDAYRTSAGSNPWNMASQATTRTVGGRIDADFARDLTLGVETYYRNWNMWGSMRMGTMVTSSNAIPDVGTRAAGVYLEYHHSFADRLRFNAGVRFDHASMNINNSKANTDLYYSYENTRFTSNIDDYPSANLHMTLALRKSADLFFGVGSTGRIPDAEERYISRKPMSGVNVGNPLLPPTRNTEVEAGLTLKHGASYIRSTAFYSNLGNYIILNNQPLLNPPAAGASMPASARSYRNVNARIYGEEVSFALALGKLLSLSGGSSYSRGIKDPQPAFGILSTNLAEMPPLRAWLAARYVHKDLFVEISGLAVNRQGRTDTDLQETVTPGYGTMNFKFGGNYRKLHGMVVVDNLLNRLYYETLSYYRDPFRSGTRVPEPGRNVFLQVAYTF